MQSAVTPESIGESIRQSRERRGFTRYDLARASGYSYELIRRIETGRCYPSVPSLIDICMALGVTPNDVLTGGSGTWKVESR